MHTHTRCFLQLKMIVSFEGNTWDPTRKAEITNSHNDISSCISSFATLLLWLLCRPPRLTFTKGITYTALRKACYRQTWNKPVQFCPSPVYPTLQEQLYPSLVFVQAALLWQLWEPLSHSSISKVKVKHVSNYSLNQRTGARYILASLTLKIISEM